MRVIATTPGGGGDTYPWSAINASAPRRIVSKATSGRPSRMDYMVLSNAIDLQWQVFLKNGAHYTASPDGRNVTRVGG